MPFKRYKLLETQLAFRKKELRRSKLLEKPINFSRFTLGGCLGELIQTSASPILCKSRICSVKPFCQLMVKWTRSRVNPVFFSLVKKFTGKGEKSQERNGGGRGQQHSGACPRNPGQVQRIGAHGMRLRALFIDEHADHGRRRTYQHAPRGFQPPRTKD